jgi:hypothetical protein
VNGGRKRAVVLPAKRNTGVGTQRFAVEFHGDGNKTRINYVFSCSKQAFKEFLIRHN